MYNTEHKKFSKKRELFISLTKQYCELIVYFIDQPKGSFQNLSYFKSNTFSYNLELVIAIYMYIELSFIKIILSKITTTYFIEMLFEIAFWNRFIRQPDSLPACLTGIIQNLLCPEHIQHSSHH